ncbi:MAPEG family protein [Sphingomonas sp. AOB5]|uniref:MAPEG family protein n=1 Tax=Sphingomonas sp. AOB5 TaxID=3034017 RepID=UPI0023F96429|nr:MAPEG family protein [Sphingomonas sp. AOB5]MDF7774211.1 MAPEG family protein [Sphingomonas sp. AOB5]
MILLPVTLGTAGAAALINFWLSIRIGRMRVAEKISVGDGGNPKMIARMRAQLNFAEYVPLILILFGLVELALGSSTWLGAVAAVFILGRICHPFGMDGWMPGRLIGVATSMLTMIGLGGLALWFGLCALAG